MGILMRNLSSEAGVIAGLDPAIHRLCQNFLPKKRDARVKPAHDDLEKPLQLAPVGSHAGMMIP